MRVDSKSLLEVLPDFEDLMTLSEEIRTNSIKKAQLETRLRTREIEVIREVTTNPKYFKDGKQPSMAFIDSTFKYAGLENELIAPRQELAETTAEIDNLKMKMDVYRLMLDIWRTSSANERKSVI